MKYNLVSIGEDSNITVFVDGEMYVADNNHANFSAIVSAALDGDESVVDLFDTALTVGKRFEAITERVSVASRRVYFDGDEIDNALTQQILRFMQQGLDDYKPLVNFFEKIAQNPEQHSREQLYVWLAAGNLTISGDGDILGYKGVQAADEDNVYKSVHSGPAIVNGVSVNGQVKQKVGDVVELGRAKVAFDPSEACSSGLHVGTWEYASSFGSHVLTVKVNPRDVVSVPTDCNGQKMRTCRYSVVSVTKSPYASAVNYDYDEDECVCCGNSYEDNGNSLCDSCDDLGCNA